VVKKWAFATLDLMILEIRRFTQIQGIST